MFLFQYIYLPTDDEQTEIIEDIFSRTGFPHVIGIIDGTHIEITKPGGKRQSIKSIKRTNIFLK